MKNIEKIEINGHYVWVDKEAEIKVGYYFLYQFGDCPEICQNDGLGDPNQKKNCFKIIATSPELNLEGVPTYVEWLARDCETSPTYAHEQGFIKGYKTAEKELYTEDDIRKAIQLAKKGNHTIVFEDFTKPFYSEEQIIEQLKK